MSFFEFDNASIDGATFLAVLLFEARHDSFSRFCGVAFQNLATLEVVENFECDFVVFLVVGSPVENPLAGLQHAGDFNQEVRAQKAVLVMAFLGPRVREIHVECIHRIVLHAVTQEEEYNGAVVVRTLTAFRETKFN